MRERIPLSEPCLNGNEGQYLQECIDSGFVSSVGPFVERFERAFADWIGAPYAVACSSGTAALHVALLAAGVESGDEVAVSSFTFIASANAVSYIGAVPLLIDSETETWNGDGELLYDDVRRRARAGERLPAAMEVVHALGHPARLQPFLAIRDEFGIPIVEDAAEALGASVAGSDGRRARVGTIGDIGCFSFNGNKVMTAGGGGMVVSSDRRVAEKVRHLTTQARLPGRGYEHDEIGFNYRLTNLAAAVGLAQLEQLDAFLAAKHRIATSYSERLQDCDVVLPPSADWADSSWWLYSLLARTPDVATGALEALALAGVEARPLWRPVHLQAPYRKVRTLGGEIAEDIAARGLSLPSSTTMTADQQDRVVAAAAAQFGYQNGTRQEAGDRTRSR